MDNQIDDAIARQPRRGLAVASLVLGIISIPTFGLAFAGGIIGLTLGAIALRRANRAPSPHRGKGLAIGGIVSSVISLFVAPLTGSAVLITNSGFSCGSKPSALQTVKGIGSAQVLYSVTKGKGRFTDLRTLVAEGMMSPALANGERNGYLFSTEPVTSEGQAPMFDTTARPASIGSSGAGNLSLYSNETLQIWEAEGADPPQASPFARIPKQGTLVR